MKIKILDSAEEDLIEGYRFYESRAEGLGDYFLSSLYSDIETIHLYAGIHSKCFGYYRLLTKKFYVRILKQIGTRFYWNFSIYND